MIQGLQQDQLREHSIMGQKDRINSLQARHHELEVAIETEESRPHPDDVEIHSLKKEKLKIKDEINVLAPG